MFKVIFPDLITSKTLLISFVPGIRFYSMKGKQTNIIKLRKTSSKNV
jgi:hypothetical protein